VRLTHWDGVVESEPVFFWWEADPGRFMGWNTEALPGIGCEQG